MASEPAVEGLAHMAETAVAVAAGTENQEAVHMAVASPEGTSPQVPVNGATTAEEYGMPAVPIRRLCMCRGNCTGRIRHAAGECGKRSVSDRPLCSSCKAHKGSSLDKTRAPDEYAYYNEGVGTSGEGAEGADGQQGGEGGGAEGVAMEGIVPGQEGGGVTPGVAGHPPEGPFSQPRKRTGSARDIADAQQMAIKRLNDQLLQQSSALQALQTCYLSLQESLQAVHRQQVMQLQAIQQLQTDVQVVTQKKE